MLQTTAAKPTVKLHLAAIRMLFDWLVVGQVLGVNPAHAVWLVRTWDFGQRPNRYPGPHIC